MKRKSVADRKARRILKDDIRWANYKIVKESKKGNCFVQTVFNDKEIISKLREQGYEVTLIGEPDPNCGLYTYFIKIKW